MSLGPSTGNVCRTTGADDRITTNDPSIERARNKNSLQIHGGEDHSGGPTKSGPELLEQQGWLGSQCQRHTKGPNLEVKGSTSGGDWNTVVGQCAATRNLGASGIKISPFRRETVMRSRPILNDQCDLWFWMYRCCWSWIVVACRTSDFGNSVYIKRATVVKWGPHTPFTVLFDYRWRRNYMIVACRTYYFVVSEHITQETTVTFGITNNCPSCRPSVAILRRV